MLPEPNTPPITPPGIRVSAANSSPRSGSNGLMQAEVWPGVYITLRRKLPRSIRFPSSSQMSISIGTLGSLHILRRIEKSSRSMILVAGSRWAGVEPMRRDEAAAEMIGCADVIEMLVAQHHHVDFFGRDADMVQASQQMRIIARQPDVDHDGPFAAANQIAVRRAVLETDLVDVVGRLDQAADLAVEQRLEGAWPAVAHVLAAFRKVTALEARS